MTKEFSHFLLFKAKISLKWELWAVLKPFATPLPCLFSEWLFHPKCKEMPVDGVGVITCLLPLLCHGLHAGT